MTRWCWGPFRIGSRGPAIDSGKLHFFSRHLIRTSTLDESGRQDNQTYKHTITVAQNLMGTNCDVVLRASMTTGHPATFPFPQKSANQGFISWSTPPCMDQRCIYKIFGDISAHHMYLGNHFFMMRTVWGILLLLHAFSSTCTQMNIHQTIGTYSTTDWKV